jgi:hypothetical protein
MKNKYPLLLEGRKLYCDTATTDNAVQIHPIGAKDGGLQASR